MAPCHGQLWYTGKMALASGRGKQRLPAFGQSALDPTNAHLRDILSKIMSSPFQSTSHYESSSSWQESLTHPPAIAVERILKCSIYVCIAVSVYVS